MKKFKNKSFKNSGFTLIELMITVAIVGILSTIAVSSYQDYTMRTKTTALYALGMSVAKAVTLNVMDGLPADNGVIIPTSKYGTIGINPAFYSVDLYYDPAYFGDSYHLSLYIRDAGLSGTANNIPTVGIYPEGRVVIGCRSIFNTSSYAWWKLLPAQWTPATCKNSSIL